MTKWEKLRTARETYGSDFDKVRNDLCMSVANTQVSILYNEVLLKEGIKYWSDKKFKPIFEMAVKLVYNGLKEISFYVRDSAFTENHIKGMGYLIEGVINDMIGDYTRTNNVNGYMLGYIPMLHAVNDLFKTEIETEAAE